MKFHVTILRPCPDKEKIVWTEIRTGKSLTDVAIKLSKSPSVIHDHAIILSIVDFRMFQPIDNGNLFCKTYIDSNKKLYNQLSKYCNDIVW